VNSIGADHSPLCFRSSLWLLAGPCLNDLRTLVLRW